MVVGNGLIILLIAYSIKRAGSAYFILDRLWQIVAGKGDVEDKKMKDFIQEYRDVERFRYLYRIGGETKSEISRLIDWMSENGLGVRTVKKAKRWINFDTLEIIDPPKKKYKEIRVFWLAICMILCVLFLSVMGSNYAVYKMNDSKIWIFAESDRITSSKVTIDKESCLNKDHLSKAGKFTKGEVDILCKEVESGNIKNEVARTLKMQRKVSAVYIIALILWMIILFSEYASAIAAYKIMEKIQKNKECLSQE